MMLALDIGNSQIYCGVMDGEKILSTFRTNSQGAATSDEMGLFLRGVLRENGIDYKAIKQITLCSVVPSIVHSVRGCCIKYFGVEPLILQPGKKTGLKILYRDPAQVGADRIANSIGAMHVMPNKNMIIVDYGTATTFDIVSKNKEYLGGMILPGLRMSMESLSGKTAQLPIVEIKKPANFIGQATVESIQSGLYYSNIATLRFFVERIRKEAFNDEPCVVIGTGGFSRMFEQEHMFDALLPDLVLIGLARFLEMNK